MATTSSDGRRLSRRDLWLALVAPLLLLGVAAIGIWNFHERRQSSWIGSSFGMFATYDNDTTRAVRVTIVYDDVETRVDVRSRFGELIERSRVTPLGSAPGRLATEVADATDADRVVVEVWTLDVETDGGLAVVPELIRRVAVP